MSNIYSDSMPVIEPGELNQSGLEKNKASVTRYKTLMGPSTKSNTYDEQDLYYEEDNGENEEQGTKQPSPPGYKANSEVHVFDR